MLYTGDTRATLDAVPSNVVTQNRKRRNTVLGMIQALRDGVGQMSGTVGFHSHEMPIYQIATARAANPIYFKALSSTKAGSTKAILGKIHARYVGQLSYFIVRRSHREPHQIMQMQTRSYGARGYRPAPRTVYRTVSSDYVIVSQAWRDGAIVEMSAHATTKEARAAFKAMTGLWPCSNKSNIDDL